MAGPRLIKVPLGLFEIDVTPFFSIGWAGVPIFFVLSGFLLGLPFAEWQAGMRARPDFGKYMLRRVLRVFPAYYAQLLVLVGLALFLQDRILIQGGLDLFRHALMLFVPPPVGVTPINPVWWTLPIELSFYMLLPFLAYWLRPHHWWRVLVLCMVSMWIWRYGVVLLMSDSPVPARLVTSYQLPGSLDMFGLGMLGALLHVNRARVPAWLVPREGRTRLAVLGLALMVSALYWMHAGYRNYWTNSPIFYVWTPLFCLGVMAIILAAVSRCRLTQTLFANRYLVFAGVISYSIYLWHAMLLAWVEQAGMCRGESAYCLPSLVAVAVPAVFVVASISYALVERPAMRWRRRRSVWIDEQKNA